MLRNSGFCNFMLEAFYRYAVAPQDCFYLSMKDEKAALRVEKEKEKCQKFEERKAN